MMLKYQVPMVGTSKGFESKDARQVRKSLGLTQEQMAKKIAVDRAYLAKIETGKLPMTDKVRNYLVRYGLGSATVELLVKL